MKHTIKFNPPQLDNILSYDGSDITYGFQKSFKIEQSEAEDIFNELLKWMWFCTSPKSEGYRVIER